MKLKLEKVRPIVAQALLEDIGEGDVTTGLFIPSNVDSQAAIVTREECVVCGLAIAEMIFKQVDPHLQIEHWVKEGEKVRPNSDLLTVTGRAGAILTAERTVLNFMQRLSGIATLTAEYVKRTKRFKVDIFDTRKTTPGLRYLEKYAVSVGGGKNHRMGLDDQILIKDNHIALTSQLVNASLKAAVDKAREQHPKKWVEIEVGQPEELEMAIEARPDALLLDNFTPDQLEEAVETIGGSFVKEASGNISLENVERVAATGVDRISIGRLTHSVRSVDLSLEFIGMEKDAGPV